LGGTQGGWAKCLKCKFWMTGPQKKKKAKSKKQKKRCEGEGKGGKGESEAQSSGPLLDLLSLKGARFAKKDV